MKIFISYRFTGEDPKELEKTLTVIKNALEKGGHSVYCSFWDEPKFRENNHTNKQILEHALREIDKADAILAFVKSADKSEGMLLEIGYALAHKKKFILVVRSDVKTVFLREMAHKLIEFVEISDLPEALGKLS